MGLAADNLGNEKDYSEAWRSSSAFLNMIFDIMGKCQVVCDLK